MISTTQVRTYSIIELPIGYKDKELEELVPMTSSTLLDTHKGKSFFSKSIELCTEWMNSNKIANDYKLKLFPF